MRRSRFTAVTVAAATASALVVAAPAANAWETKYDRESNKCSISFAQSEKEKVNAAFKLLFSEMAKQTDNADLKLSLNNAANDPFFDADEDVITMTPDEALERGGIFYGVDLFTLLLPYGIDGVVKNVGIENVLDGDLLAQVLKDVDMDAVVKEIDFEAAVGGKENLPVADVMKALPIKEMLNSFNLTPILLDPGFLGAILKPEKNLENLRIGNIVEKLTANKKFQNELSNTINQVDLNKTLADVLEAADLDLRVVIKNVLAQPKVKDALKKELKKANFDAVLKKLFLDEHGQPDVQKLLGYKISDVTLAAEAAIRSVGPQVGAPILTMNDAFTACSMHSDQVKEKPTGSTVGSSGRKQGSSEDHVKGSVASGSSLDMKGLMAVGIFGVLATLLATGVAGFAARPIIENFMK